MFETKTSKLPKFVNNDISWHVLLPPSWRKYVVNMCIVVRVWSIILRHDIFVLIKKIVHHCFDYPLESCHVLQNKFMRICFFRYFQMIRAFSAEFGCHYSTVRWNHLLKLQYPKRKQSFHQGKLKSSFVFANFLQFHDAKPGFPKTIFFDSSKIKIPQWLAN